MTKRKPRGKEFELAVHEFAKSLDPSSEVLFDHKVIDRDTGAPRQCDVWINTKMGGHWPIQILVSCKDYNRPLHVGHIEAFLGEIRSTGASTGIIYSRKGVTEGALKKARANGVSCCRLFTRDRTPDLPKSLVFYQYLCRSKLLARATFYDIHPDTFANFNELFDLDIQDGEGKTTVFKRVCKNVSNAMRECVRQASETKGFAQDWENNTEVNFPNGKIIINVLCTWAKYREKIEARRMSGSYCINDGSFKGSVEGPSVSLYDEHPGEGWEQIKDHTLAPQGLIMTMFSDIEKSLETLRDRKMSFTQNPSSTP